MWWSSSGSVASFIWFSDYFLLIFFRNSHTMFSFIFVPPQSNKRWICPQTIPISYFLLIAYLPSSYRISCKTSKPLSPSFWICISLFFVPFSLLHKPYHIIKWKQWFPPLIFIITIFIWSLPIEIHFCRLPFFLKKTQTCSIWCSISLSALFNNISHSLRRLIMELVKLFSQ